MARLAALVPKSRVTLTRFHGGFAPNSKYRIIITPAKRGKGAKKKQGSEPDDKTLMEQHAAMTWARRFKRVFSIDISECENAKASEDYCLYRRPCGHSEDTGSSESENRQSGTAFNIATHAGPAIVARTGSGTERLTHTNQHQGRCGQGDCRMACGHKMEKRGISGTRQEILEDAERVARR